MFASISPDQSSTRSLNFVAALFLQSAILLAIASHPFPQFSGGGVRPKSARMVTPIYFQKEAPVAAEVPEEAPPLASHATPEQPKESTTAMEETLQADAESTDGGAADESVDNNQGLAQFPAWSMNRGGSVLHFGHQMNSALPVFTPDPPILHGSFPKSARGKDVVLEVIINEQGYIVQARVLQAVGEGVEQSIAETLRRWIFVPAKINGIAIASRRELRFHFPG